jgi:hypothetical protein
MGLMNYIKEKYEQSPSTLETLSAEFRRGLKDLQEVVLSPIEGSMRTRDELGTIGNPTTIEIYRSRKGLDSPSPSAEEPKQIETNQREPEID